MQQNNASTQPETKEGRHEHLPGDSLASNPQVPPFLSGSTSLEGKRTQQHASSSAASEDKAQNCEQSYASTSSERQAQHPSQSCASTSSKAREQTPTLREVPPMHSHPSDLSQFPDGINISVQHLPSSLHFPTCSVEVPPQDFGEISTSWEEYASQQHSSSDLESSHNALLAHFESLASFPPLLDTEPPSLTLDQPIPSSVNVSLGQMLSFTQSNLNPTFDLFQFLDALPGAPMEQQHFRSSGASQPPFSSQAQSLFHSDDHQSSFSTPNQDIPSAMASVGLDGHFAMDCDDDIILKTDGSGRDIVMDIDDQGPPYEPLLQHPSDVRVPSYTASIETPAQIYDSPLAQPPNFVPASYQPPTQPLRQTPTFVQDPPYNRSTCGRDAPHCELTFMQETPLYRAVSDLLGTPQSCS